MNELVSILYTLVGVLILVHLMKKNQRQRQKIICKSNIIFLMNYRK
jgi:hypothetical protein